MLEIIPVLPVNEPCSWCEPQQCFTADLWWGEVLMCFYSKDAARLEPSALNDEACMVLKQLTMAITPESDEVISPEALRKELGRGLPILCCYWADFKPAVSLAQPNQCCIPVEDK